MFGRYPRTVLYPQHYPLLSRCRIAGAFTFTGEVLDALGQAGGDTASAAYFNRPGSGTFDRNGGG